MGNPSIVDVTSIYGTTTLNAITTAGVVVADNAGSATTNKLFKVNLLSISNVDGVNDANVSVQVLSNVNVCLLYTSPSPRDATLSRMPSSA